MRIIEEEEDNEKWRHCVFNMILYENNNTIHSLEKVRYPCLCNIPFLWLDMIEYFEEYKPLMMTKRVTWKFSYKGWHKYNTDGASRDNPGQSSFGFYMRDSGEDLVYARAVKIEETTNIVARAKAIVDGFSYCVAHDLLPLILETDFLVMKKNIEGE